MGFPLIPTSRRFRTRLALTLILLTAVYLVSRFRPVKRRPHDYFDESVSYFIPIESSPTGLDPERCTHFPHDVFKNDVQVILKTGSAEAQKKVPILLKTTLACVDDLIIFSDHEDKIGGQEVRDALANLDERYFERDDRLEYYKRLRKGNSTLTDPDGKDGWHVDKYKFIPMVEYVWRDRPKKKWFVFLETDTYIFWDNMIRHLEHFDSSTPLFMGSPVWLGRDPPFAHGGTGLVLSAAAMRKMTDGNEEFGAVGSHQMTFETLKEKCCGDDVLTVVLREKGVYLAGYNPMFNGERLSTIRFNENGVGDTQGWCEPLITLHHVGPHDYPVTHKIAAKLRNPKRALLHRDIYFEYVRPLLEVAKSHWNSMAEDVKLTSPEDKATHSPEACRLACRHDRKCMQYRFRDNLCTLGHSIRLGNEDKGGDDASGVGVWHSGWMMDRIAAFEKDARECARAEWVRPNPRPECERCWDEY